MTEPTPITTGINHQFMIGYTYHLSAISNEDAAAHNWLNATPLGAKYPIIKDGSWFIRNGWNTVGDFYERGKDDAGKPFRMDKKFLLTVQLPPDNLSVYVHCGQFSKQASATNGNPYGMNGYGMHDGITGTQKRTRISPEIREQMALAGHSQAVIQEISQSAKDTRETLQQQITRLQTQVDTLTKENAKLNAESTALKNQNFLLQQSNNQLTASIDATKDKLEEQYNQKMSSFLAEQAKVAKIEKERNELEHQAVIAEVIREKRKEWIQELKVKDQGLADEMYDEAKDDLRSEWRELEDAQYRFKREKEEWEKKRGLGDKGLSVLGEFASTAEGKVATKAGLTVLGGFTNAIAAKFFPQEFQAVNEQYAAAEEAARLEEERKRQRAAQVAQQAASQQSASQHNASQQATDDDDDEKLVPTTTQKPENYAL